VIEVVGADRLVPPSIFGVLSQETMLEILGGLADAARGEWIRIVGNELHSTRQDYIAGLQPTEFREGVAVIALVGVLPNLLEKGMAETDLHDTLLGPGVAEAQVGERGKHPRKAGGYYRAIPFRHQTPGSAGLHGQPMGAAYAGHELVPDARRLGQSVYRRAKELEASVSQPGGGTEWGGRLAEGLAPKLREYHAVDIYAGMVRLEKTYEAATQSQYMTFRTISRDGAGQPVGSSPWIRPATDGKNFAERVANYVREMAPSAFTAYAQAAGDGK